MTVMLHPNREEPQRFRVWDRELGVQAYFSFKKYGKEKAEKLANEMQKDIDKRKKARRLQEELGINKLFDVEGKVKGLRRKVRNRDGRKTYEFLSIQVVVAPKTQRTKEISLNCRTFDDAWEMAKKTLLEFHSIQSNFEIQQGFKNAKRHYW